jgi:Thiolase, N-terminal domain
MNAFICDAIRTPIGRYGGHLSSIRADDLAAIPISALMARNPSVNWQCVDEVIYVSSNQAGEDNRNVARMAALLAGLPVDVPGVTVNRLCASRMDAIGMAARAIQAGDYHLEFERNYLSNATLAQIAADCDLAPGESPGEWGRARPTASRSAFDSRSTMTRPVAVQCVRSR